jgi:hypothetical protein
MIKRWLKEAVLNYIARRGFLFLITNVISLPEY